MRSTESFALPLANALAIEVDALPTLHQTLLVRTPEIEEP